MDLIGFGIAMLEVPILMLKSFDSHFTYLMNGLLPQYAPNIYLWLLHLPIPSVPWPNG